MNEDEWFHQMYEAQQEEQMGQQALDHAIGVLGVPKVLELIAQFMLKPSATEEPF